MTRRTAEVCCYLYEYAFISINILYSLKINENLCFNTEELIQQQQQQQQQQHFSARKRQIVFPGSVFREQHKEERPGLPNYADCITKYIHMS